MVTIVFAVSMLIGFVFFVNGLVRAHFHWEHFKAPLFFGIVSSLLFGYSVFGPVENWMLRMQMSYTAIACSIVFVLASAAAVQRAPNN